MRRPPAGASRGTALLMCAVFLSALGITAVGAVVVLNSLNKESVYQREAGRAQVLAEAGLQDALGQLRQNPQWRAGFSMKPLAGGSYTVTLSGSAAPLITATGRAAPLANFAAPYATLQVRAETLPIPSMPYGIWSQGNLSMQVPETVDSYNSETQADPGFFGNSAAVWVNGSLSMALLSIDEIYGQAVVVGTYTAPLLGLGPGATGGVAHSAIPLAMPAVSSTYFAAANDNTAGFSPASVYNAATGSVQVNTGATASLASGVYVLHDLSVDGTLTAAVSNGPVVIFVTGTLTVAGSIVNPGQIPGNLIIYSDRANNLNFSGSKSFYGVVHAPLAQVSVSGPFFGAIAAGQLSLNNGAVIHQDLSLQRPAVSAIRVYPGSWQTLLTRQ